MHEWTFSFSNILTANVCSSNAVNAYILGGEIFLQLRLYVCGWVSKNKDVFSGQSV